MNLILMSAVVLGLVLRKGLAGSKMNIQVLSTKTENLNTVYSCLFLHE